MEEQEQTFAALVLEVLMGRSAELERQWADRAQLAKLRVDDRTGDPTTTLQIGGDGTGHLVRTMLAAAAAHSTQDTGAELAGAARKDHWCQSSLPSYVTARVAHGA